MLKFIAAGLAALTLSTAPALAQRTSAPPACPDDIEQRAYNVVEAMKAGQVSDANAVYGFLDQASTVCDDRPETLHLVALGFAIFGEAQTADATRQSLFLKAWNAARQADRVWSDPDTPSGEARQITQANGQTKVLDLRTKVDDTLRDTIIPQLALLHAAGQEVYAFTGQATMPLCPYRMETAFQARARAEAAGLYFAATRTDVDVPADIASIDRRLKQLRRVCSAQRAFISWQLARTHSRAAVVAEQAGDAEAAASHARAAIEAAEFMLEVQLPQPEDQRYIDGAPDWIAKTRARFLPED